MKAIAASFHEWQKKSCLGGKMHGALGKILFDEWFSVPHYERITVI